MAIGLLVGLALFGAFGIWSNTNARSLGGEIMRAISWFALFIGTAGAVGAVLS